MLRAVIVDDEIPVLNLLKIFLEKTEQVDILQTFIRPLEALDNIYKIKPDVAFLDIEMPGMNGLELASRLIEQDDELMVVFVTGYNQFALEAFQVNAIDYLLKPVNPNTIQKCISRLTKLKGSNNIPKSEKMETRIRCFGDFEVYGNNGIVKWATRKVEEMLAYFIVHRDMNIDRWLLGETLWPDEEPEKIKANLYTTIFRLRKTIREEGLPIEISSKKGGQGTYRCILGQLSCDLIKFEDMVRKNITVDKSNIDEFESICALYHGDLFSKKDYDWCESIKEWMQRYYLNMLKNMGLFYSKQELYQNTIDKLLTAAGVEPFDEEIQRSLLKVYDAQKNRAMLIRCYEEFALNLFKEMGVAPQIETHQLFLKLIDQ